MSSTMQKVKTCQPCVETPRWQKCMRLSLLVLTWISMMLAYVGTCGCQFMVVTNKYVPEDEPVALGFFNLIRYDSEFKKNGCIPYLETERLQLASGGAWTAGRTFAVMTVVFMSMAFLIALGSMLFIYPETSEKYRLWRVLQGLIVSSFFTQIFAFCVFGAEVCDFLEVYNFETECAPGASSGLAALNVCVLLILIMMGCAVPGPPHPVFKLWEEDDDDNDNSNKKYEEPKNATRPTDAIVPVEEPRRPSRKKSDVRKSASKRNGDKRDSKRQSTNSQKSKKSSKKVEKAPSEDFDEDDWVSDAADDDDDDDDIEEVTYTREKHPDGTKVIKEVTHKDGSKTITETIEASDDEED